MAGIANAQDRLVVPLSLLNMDLMNAPRLAIPYADDQVDEEGHLALTGSAPHLKKQAKAFVAFLRKRKAL